MIGIYPGSFDPVTNGHMDIIERSSRMVDKLVVAVLCNRAKKPTFSYEERVRILKQCTAHLENVEVETFDGLTVDFARRKGAHMIIRGLRAISDFENEFSMASMNKQLADDIETMFLMTNTQWSYLSSSMVREIAAYDGDIEPFVPAALAPQIKKALRASLQEEK